MSTAPIVPEIRGLQGEEEEREQRPLLRIASSRDGADADLAARKRSARRLRRRRRRERRLDAGGTTRRSPLALW